MKNWHPHGIFPTGATLIADDKIPEMLVGVIARHREK